VNLAVATVSVLVLVVGVAFAAVGMLGLRGGLRRNRYVGVRTPAALRSDESFLLANQVAGLPTLVGGVVGVLGAATSLAMNSSPLPLVISLVGMLAIVVAGAVLGNRAAETMPEPAPAVPSGCTGCACGGCSLKR
jgi:uncharacterized membrane protein